MLDLIDLIPLDPPIRILAQTARPATVRSLDAIHLGTALHAGQALTSFVTYDATARRGHRSRAPSRFTCLACSHHPSGTPSYGHHRLALEPPGGTLDNRTPSLTADDGR